MLGLDKRQQIKLLRERATGTIKTLKELREKVKTLRETEAVSGNAQSESKRNVSSYSTVFRLKGDELSFLPYKINFATISAEQKAELRGFLSAALEKLGV